jgi:hypothetical protein
MVDIHPELQRDFRPGFGAEGDQDTCMRIAPDYPLGRGV